MKQFSETITGGHPQQAIWGKCFHPGGKFIEFKREEIELSIPERFEKIVRKYPDRVAVESDDQLVFALSQHDAGHVVDPSAQLGEQGPAFGAGNFGRVAATRVEHYSADGHQGDRPQGQ